MPENLTAAIMVVAGIALVTLFIVAMVLNDVDVAKAVATARSAGDAEALQKTDVQRASEAEVTLLVARTRANLTALTRATLTRSSVADEARLFALRALTSRLEARREQLVINYARSLRG